MTRINKIKGKSDIVLPQLTSDNYEKFDIVFIDGSHYADDVLSDAINAWRLLALNGVIIFDDYLWRAEKYGWKKNPANGVNLFLRLVQDDYQLLHLGHQCAIKKNKFD